MLGLLSVQVCSKGVLNLTWLASQLTQLLLRNHASVIYPEFFSTHCRKTMCSIEKWFHLSFTAPIYVFLTWRDSLHGLRSYCWKTARQSFTTNFSMHPVGKTMRWIKKWSKPTNQHFFFEISVITACTVDWLERLFFCVSLSSWVISLTVLGASVTNLNEPPRGIHYNVG